MGDERLECLGDALRQQDEVNYIILRVADDELEGKLDIRLGFVSLVHEADEVI